MKISSKNNYTSLIALEAMMNSNMKTIRAQQVMLGTDVAKLYGVSLEELNKQIKKNSHRFPKEFMFKLTPEELAVFKGEKFPCVFTEQGILMTGGTLKSEQAIKIHVQLVRYFVQLFNQALNDIALSKELEPMIKDEKIFEVLKQMAKK